MKKTIRIILIILLAALIIIQFFRPAKNISDVAAANDISTKYTIPDTVQNLLKVACNDCHSNNSRYPWYWNIQPFAWFLNNHIQEGKRHLNFSAFTFYPVWKQYKRFDDIKKEVKDGDMPLTSYTIIHKDAVLDEASKLAIKNWAEASRKQIENSFPADSLIAPKHSQTAK